MQTIRQKATTNNNWQKTVKNSNTW